MQCRRRNIAGDGAFRSFTLHRSLQKPLKGSRPWTASAVVVAGSAGLQKEKVLAAAKDDASNYL